MIDQGWCNQYVEQFKERFNTKAIIIIVPELSFKEFYEFEIWNILEGNPFQTYTENDKIYLHPNIENETIYHKYFQKEGILKIYTWRND